MKQIPGVLDCAALALLAGRKTPPGGKRQIVQKRTYVGDVEVASSDASGKGGNYRLFDAPAATAQLEKVDASQAQVRGAHD